MRNKRTQLLYTFLWGLLILFLLTLPMKEFETHEVTYYDKGVHFILFGVFAFLLFRYFLLIKKLELFRSSIYAFGFSFLYAFSLEWLQNFVPGRTVDGYDLFFGAFGAGIAMIYALVVYRSTKPSLLLHICCIGCGVYVSQVLRDEFNITLYFYNPNIFPLSEYDKRLEEIQKVAKMYKMKVILGNYDHKKWRDMVKGHEADQEKGARCMMCYRERLEETARYASENGFHYFATTLTTSPHKNAEAIMKFGKDLGREYEIGFLERDFKKQDGFKKSSAMSRDLGLYRQDYCGCEFSLADRERRKVSREVKFS